MDYLICIVLTLSAMPFQLIYGVRWQDAEFAWFAEAIAQFRELTRNLEEDY